MRYSEESSLEDEDVGDPLVVVVEYRTLILNTSVAICSVKEGSTTFIPV